MSSCEDGRVATRDGTISCEPGLASALQAKSEGVIAMGEGHKRSVRF